MSKLIKQPFTIIHTLLATVFLAVFLISSAQAHTFYWVKMKTHIKANSDDGKLSSIDFTWVYDKDISKIMVESRDMSKNMRNISLIELADDIMGDLAKAEFFVHLPSKLINSDSHAIKFEDDELTLKFTLTLKEPIEFSKDKPTEIWVYDPNFMGDLSYAKDNDLTLDDNLAKTCKITQKRQAKESTEEEKEEQGHDHKDKYMQLIKIECAEQSS